MTELYANPMGVNLLSLVLLVFTVARLTRLIVDDSITIGFRSWVARNFGEDSGANTLVNCIWCSGFWVSVFSTAALFPFLQLPWWTFPLIVLAVAQAAPMILQISDRVGGP